MEKKRIQTEKKHPFSLWLEELRRKAWGTSYSGKAKNVERYFQGVANKEQ